MSKRRNIPSKVAAEVEFKSDRTCCVCRTPLLQHQLHHLDGDPSNNNPGNLAVLCLQHHAEAEVKGGLGRKLSADQIRRFRSEWYAVVESQRGAGDNVARAPRDMDAQARLRRLIRTGTELQSEAYFAGRSAESTRDRLAFEERKTELAEFRQREDAWTRTVEDALAGSPAALEFVDVHGIPSTDFYAIHNRVEARVKFLREALDATISTHDTPEERLQGAIEDGMRLRSHPKLESPNALPFAEDPLFRWARRSYHLLLQDGVLTADAFYGEDPSLGPACFGLVFVIATGDEGRAHYLETRLNLLKAALAGRPSAPGPLLGGAHPLDDQ